ncbi:hypothetical protein [uncultured Rikenella sp.]|uniref:hypothetical protein n=1 Tax=uncultured Rikenella sp. TaxID=368003 RepID=UPI002607FA1B|nr:hypothetical protein [uncultured Rikenella sp.]
MPLGINRRDQHPAPGFRERANGELSYVGNYGFSYSSSVSGSNGMYLDFNVTHLYSSIPASRTLVATVFSCVASRNKRNTPPRASAIRARAIQ